MSQLSRNWHKREIKIGTSVNFCLIERVRFVAQACFLGPDSERFTETVRAGTETVCAETKTVRAETETVRAETETVRAGTGASEVEGYRQCVHMTDTSSTESLEQTLMEKKHLWRFHLNTGIDGIFVDKNLIGKPALCDAFSNFNI
jgi:hypothetical protein